VATGELQDRIWMVFEVAALPVTEDGGHLVDRVVKIRRLVRARRGVDVSSLMDLPAVKRRDRGRRQRAHAGVDGRVRQLPADHRLGGQAVEIQFAARQRRQRTGACRHRGDAVAVPPVELPKSKPVADQHERPAIAVTVGSGKRGHEPGQSRPVAQQRRDLGGRDIPRTRPDRPTQPHSERASAAGDVTRIRAGVRDPAVRCLGDGHVYRVVRQTRERAPRRTAQVLRRMRRHAHAQQCSHPGSPLTVRQGARRRRCPTRWRPNGSPVCWRRTR
jgi:hypothetical protein